MDLHKWWREAWKEEKRVNSSQDRGAKKRVVGSIRCCEEQQTERAGDSSKQGRWEGRCGLACLQ